MLLTVLTTAPSINETRHVTPPSTGNHARDESIHLPRHISPHLPKYSWARYALTQFQVLQASACSCLSITRTQEESCYTLTEWSCFLCLGIPVPLCHPYLGVVTPPEMVNQFNGHVFTGFSPVPEGHRGTGSGYVFSSLVTSIFTVAKITIHGQRHPHSPLSREFPRFVLYSHYTAVVISRTALLARSTRTTTRRTFLWAYSHDHGGFSLERVQQALTFPPTMGCSFCTYFHDHGASLTLASSPSSHVSPTMWTTVDLPGFLSSIIFGRNCWPSYRSSGSHNPKICARRPFTSPKRIPF